MYEKNDKRRIYWLIDEYLGGRIDEPTFCDEFYYSFSLEMDRKDFTEEELSVFSELDRVASRFSQFDEDHLLDAKAFSTKEELSHRIRETQKLLTLE